MPTVLSHPAVPLALCTLVSQRFFSPELLITGVICSIVPDLDVIGFSWGIRYGDLFGHRGLTHSFFFAALISGIIALFFNHIPYAVSFFFLFLCTASHGLLDALTNGGLGVAFFSPFSNHRYFFNWRPIDVSPIGIAAFFTPYGMRVLIGELRWVWFPSMAVAAVALMLRYWR